jgi:hypothetical protein
MIKNWGSYQPPTPHCTCIEFTTNYLLISTVVTDGLVDDMAPGLLLAMLVVFSFALFIIDRVTFLNPFGFRHCHLVFTAFLALNFLSLPHYRHWQRLTNLKI